MSPQRWGRLEALYDAAVELPPEDRERFLAEQCGGDEDLRRELAAMLTGSSGGITGAVEHAAAAVVDGSDAWIGQRLGAYRIVRLVGQGGMGAVFEGVREDTFQKKVAIKLVKYSFDSDLARRRFQQERQILARLDHANIARLLDGGDYQGRLPYLVMEFVEGRPLLEAAAALTLPARLRLFQKILAAVSYAHSELVVHRDIKPANILVTQDGEPKLLDFGLARLTGPEASGTLTVTAVMTPDYASPEQVKGEPTGVASDIYSLGATLYEMLSGARPHGLETYSTAEIYRAICEQEIRPPSERAADPALRRQLRGDLDTLILHAMAKEPGARYPSADAFRAEIDRYLEGRPLNVRPASAPERAWKFVRRNRLTVAAAVAVAASLIAGTAVSTIEARRAQRRFAQVRELANTFLFQFYDQVTPLPGSTAVRASIVDTARKYLDGLAKEAGNDRDLILELAAAYERLSTVQSRNGSASLGQVEDARRSLQHAISLYERLKVNSQSPLDLRLKLANVLWLLGRLEYNNTRVDDPRLDAAEAATSRSIALLRDSSDPVALRRRASAESSMGQMRLQRGKTREALALFESAERTYLDLLRSSKGEAGISGDLIIIQDRISRAEASLGDLDSAVRRVEGVLQATPPCDHKVLPPPCRNRAVRLVMEGDFYGAVDRANLGDPVKAAAFYEQGVHITEALAAQDPNDRETRYSFATQLGKLGDALSSVDPKRAIALYGRALEISRALVSKEQLNEVRSSYLGAMIRPLVQLGRFAEARQALNAAIQEDGWCTAKSPYAERLLELPVRLLEARILWGENRSDEARARVRATIGIVQELRAQRPENFTPIFFLCQSNRLLASMASGRERAYFLRESAAAWHSWPATTYTQREEQKDLAAAARVN